MSKFFEGQFIRVSNNAPFHAGLVGEFQFYGEGPSEGVVVLKINGNSLIAIDAGHAVSLGTNAYRR